MTDPLVEHVAQALHANDNTNTCRPDGFAQQGLCDCVHRAEAAVDAVRERPDLLVPRWEDCSYPPPHPDTCGRRLVGEWEPTP